LLRGCNHYLTHGAEVDQHIAKELFPDDSGLDLLQRNRKAKIVSFVASFSEAAAAANPYGVRPPALPALLGMMLSAWAFRLVKPDYSVAKERHGTALKFPAPISAQQLERIEDIDDSMLA
jgi:hypothetical protein